MDFVRQLALLASALLMVTASSMANANQCVSLPMFELRMNGIVRGHIVGSMHRGYLGSKPAIDRLQTDFVAHASAVFFEIDGSSTDVKSAGREIVTSASPSKKFMRDWISLRHERLVQLGRRHGLAAEIVPTMLSQLPAFDLYMILLGFCEAIPAQSHSIDDLIKLSLRKGVQAGSLESIEDQYGWLRVISADGWRSMLDDALDYAEKYDCSERFSALLAANSHDFRNGNSDRIYKNTRRHYAPWHGLNYMFARVDDRNPGMARTIDRLLRKHPDALFVVGVLHLGGDASIQSHLGQLGWTVSPLSAGACRK